MFCLFLAFEQDTTQALPNSAIDEKCECCWLEHLHSLNLGIVDGNLKVVNLLILIMPSLPS
jgi:hypothetical protein